MSALPDRAALIQAAGDAARNAYAPYSGFRVGAALAFDDGTVVTGANVENASYGLSLCAETLAAGLAMSGGRRGGLIAVAISGAGDAHGGSDVALTPCGRCRQVLGELAGLGDTDPVVWCSGGGDTLELRLSELLPHAFGPNMLKS